MFLRPATMNDHDAVLALAKQAGFGMTSLPPDAEVLREKIETSVASFANNSKKKGQESFFFVLEDPDKNGHIAGTCGIKSHIGLTQPFYSYKLTTITQVSTQLDIFSKHTILQVTNDLTGSTEVGALFLQPEYRRDRIGKMLSLARFMFIAAHKQYFSEQVIAEMRGVHDSEGQAPFYNALPQHFFNLPFTEADYINATQGNQFINDLVPKYPIYMSLLPKEAQHVIGRVNAASEPAKVMLEKQGFKHTGYVDIFDGGPTLIVERDQIKTVRESRVERVSEVKELPEGTQKYMLTNDKFETFRASIGRAVEAGDGTLHITPRVASRANVNVGDMVRYITI
ncbi:MAG: arginine N-succinyltransferase [Alphaproteobacteria bacterium]|nr:arginine N-succinyltransferase [Alphaproteobacteria bacterium]